MHKLRARFQITRIGRRLGHEASHYKIAKLFEVGVADDPYRWQRDQSKITDEARLDGISIVRTSLPDLPASAVVAAYKSLALVECTFGSTQSQPRLRPVAHCTSKCSSGEEGPWSWRLICQQGTPGRVRLSGRQSGGRRYARAGAGAAPEGRPGPQGRWRPLPARQGEGSTSRRGRGQRESHAFGCRVATGWQDPWVLLQGYKALAKRNDRVRDPSSVCLPSMPPRPVARSKALRLAMVAVMPKLAVRLDSQPHEDRRWHLSSFPGWVRQTACPMCRSTLLQARQSTRTSVAASTDPAYDWEGIVVFDGCTSVRTDSGCSECGTAKASTGPEQRSKPS